MSAIKELTAKKDVYILSTKKEEKKAKQKDQIDSWHWLHNQCNYKSILTEKHSNIPEKKTNMEEVKYKRLAMGKKTSTIHFTYFIMYTSNHFIIEQDIDSEVFMKKKMPQYFLNRSTYCNCVHVLRYRLNFSSFLWYFQWMLLTPKAYNSPNDTLLLSFHFH